jgi:hypothetical protein
MNVSSRFLNCVRGREQLASPLTSQQEKRSCATVGAVRPAEDDVRVEKKAHSLFDVRLELTGLFWGYAIGFFELLQPFVAVYFQGIDTSLAQENASVRSGFQQQEYFVLDS